MPTLKQKTKQVPGLQYIVDNLQFLSTAGRQRMLSQPLLTDPVQLRQAQADVRLMRQALGDATQAAAVAQLRHQLMQLHDIGTTLQGLASRVLLTEVDLFEIKNLSRVATLAAQALGQLGLAQRFPLPDLDGCFQLLDPDHTGMTHFYIYDSYHPRLGALRRQMRQADDDAMAQLLSEQDDIQQQVILRLCDALRPHADALARALGQLAYLDTLCARAELADAWCLVEPQEQGQGLLLRGLVNPRLRQRNLDAGLRYQPVDIQLGRGVTLVTGANMAGKTVLLKSVGVAQLMYQFGLPVPADAAALEPFDDILFCIGDEQDEMNGLSSFAAEITRISDLLRRSQAERLLILIDEPARTTNPVEGKAIVQALVQLLQGRDSVALVTTHYSQLGVACRRLRVKGFVERLVDAPLTAGSINRYIDYSLEPDDSDQAPSEALRIAELLGCDADLLAAARGFISAVGE